MSNTIYGWFLTLKVLDICVKYRINPFHTPLVEIKEKPVEVREKLCKRLSFLPYIENIKKALNVN